MKKLLLLFFISISWTGFSQNFLSWQFNDRYFSFTVGTGSSTYFGELNANNSIHKSPSQFNVGLEARLLSRLGARLEAHYLTLDGADSNAPDSSFQQQRNLSFESRNFQVHLGMVYYIKPYRGDYYKRWIFDPYLVAGVGYMLYNPAARLGNERFLLRDATTEGVSYKKWVVTLPLGAGAKFKINEFLNINLEAVYHFAFTDYLDDVSGSYATEFASSTAELLSDRKDEIGVINSDFYDQIQPGSQRGNSNDNDRFLLINIKAEIFIPSDLFSRKSNAIIKKPSAY